MTADTPAVDRQVSAVDPSAPLAEPPPFETRTTMVQVVSLDTATARRRDFAQAAGEGTRTWWQFLDAHRGPSRSLDLDERFMRRNGGRILGANELGCYSSHFAAFQALLSSDCEQLIVLEDDVIADWAYLRFVASHRLSAMGIDYLRLFAKVPGRFRRVRSGFLEPYHHLIQFIGPALGTQAYVVTRRGAERLVDSLRTIRRPIDQALDETGRHGLPNLAVVPFPVIERFVPSSIGEARFTDRPAGLPRLLTTTIRRWDQARRAARVISPRPRIGSPQRW